MFSSQSPPWYALGLATLDAVCWCLGWNATVHYGYTIAPPDLVATMTSSVATIEWVIGKRVSVVRRHSRAFCLVRLLHAGHFSGKGLGSLISGQLLGNTPLETPGLFQITFLASTLIGGIIMVCYHTIGKRRERVLVAKKQDLLLERVRRKEKEEADTSSKGNDPDNGDKKNLGVGGDFGYNDSYKSMRKVPGSWGGSSMVSTN